MGKDIFIIGIGGHAVKIDSATGTEVWRTKLKGHDFVTVHETGGQIYAGAGGVLFCLESSTGKILWKNDLKGLGTGLIAFMSNEDAVAAAALTKKRIEEAAAASAAGS